MNDRCLVVRGDYDPYLQSKTRSINADQASGRKRPEVTPDRRG
jgi:hypothetical protein